MDFEEAFRRVVNLEGGFTLHKNQTEEDVTYAGIYKKAHPNWDGWKYISANKTPPVDLVRFFYEREFYDKFINIEDGTKRYILFEYAVNAGVAKAIKLGQTVCGEAIDGVLGNKTKMAINNMDKDLFILRFSLARIAHYNDLAKNDKYRPYLRGWINRTLEVLK